MPIRLFFIIAATLLAFAAHATPTILLPRTGLTPDDVAIVINEADALSRRVGDYYRLARGIPESNIVRVHFAPERATLPPEEFAQLKREIDLHTPVHVQAYAVTWTQPYRVGCMSLTSALALGFDERYCSTQCRPTAGSAYFRRTARELTGVFPIELLEQEAIDGRDDVLFYFTGLARVPKLDTLHFQPGALADHLTSFGGQLTDSSQMSSLDWLAAGATASFGTVVEPCNHPEKFPLPALAMFFYAGGASAIEAYWKSVTWPGQGVFIGEPLDGYVRLRF